MDKPNYSPEQFPHWTELDVRFRDLDPLNHVNNSVFNTYFEEARIGFIRDIPEFNESMKPGFSFVLVHVELAYLQPVFHPETILIGSSVKEYGNTSICAFQAIYSKKDKTLKAVAETTGVWYDMNRQRPARLPNIPQQEKYLYKPISDG